MCIKDEFMKQCESSNNYYLVQVINEDHTSLVIYLHKDSSLHDLYKQVKLHKKEDIFSYTNVLMYNDTVLPNYSHISLKEGLGADDDEREFSVNYKNKKNVQFDDLSPKKNKWVWPPNGGFVCGR